MMANSFEIELEYMCLLETCTHGKSNFPFWTQHIVFEITGNNLTVRLCCKTVLITKKSLFMMEWKLIEFRCNLFNQLNFVNFVFIFILLARNRYSRCQETRDKFLRVLHWPLFRGIWFFTFCQLNGSIIGSNKVHLKSGVQVFYATAYCMFYWLIKLEVQN